MGAFGGRVTDALCGATRPADATLHAQVHLLSGEVRAATAGELEVAIPARGPGDARTRLATRGGNALADGPQTAPMAGEVAL